MIGNVQSCIVGILWDGSEVNDTDRDNATKMY